MRGTTHRRPGENGRGRAPRREAARSNPRGAQTRPHRGPVGAPERLRAQPPRRPESLYGRRPVGAASSLPGKRGHISGRGTYATSTSNILRHFPRSLIVNLDGQSMYGALAQLNVIQQSPTPQGAQPQTKKWRNETTTTARRPKPTRSLNGKNQKRAEKTAP